MQKNRNHSRTAFTLIELLVVVAIIALLISILLPSLQRARRQARSAVCLSNLRGMGQAVTSYAAESKDALPGPLHPAVYREVADRPDEYFRNRFLLYFLRRQLSDSSGDAGNELGTCPAAAGINPDENFYEKTGNRIQPTHYVINTVGTYGDQGGPVGGVRTTNPAYYFGWSHWSGYESSVLPQKLAKVQLPSEEWMIADAWYRMRPGPFEELQQEGPYQWDWSGQGFPTFAPHFSGRVYDYTGDDDRRAESSLVREGKDDGLTNTAYFDGHASPVESKVLNFSGFEVLYGFRGTRNPAMIDPEEDHPVWDAAWN
jgi:prepilin-type N-terminal cleavage/methylation domain-containing protein/prepilin-type processing-associated H-X9-DG protein